MINDELAQRMLAAADTLEEASALYDYNPNAPWRPTELRTEAVYVASEAEAAQ